MLHGLKKYTDHPLISLEQLKRTRAYQILARLERGGQMTYPERCYITSRMLVDDRLKNGIYIDGWYLLFGNWIKRYLIKQHEEWREVYATDLQALHSCICDYIQEYVEMPN